MDDGKKIIIKNEQFRRLRNNLRKVLLKAIYNELDKLRTLDNLYWEKKNLTPTQKKRERFLYNKKERLYWLKEKSILRCSGVSCGATDRNMVYHAKFDQWYCVDCYEKFEEEYNPNRYFNQGTITKKNAMKPCYILRWCPYGIITTKFLKRKLKNDFSCKIFENDCPTFYISEDFNEDSPVKIQLTEKQIEYLKFLKFKTSKKYLYLYERFAYPKPCKELEWCPYGHIIINSKLRKEKSVYTCNLFNRDCPVYYLGGLETEKYPNPTKKYTINEYLQLKLIRGETKVFINDKEFIVCKKLVLDLPVKDFPSYSNIKSMDEFIEKTEIYSENYDELSKFDILLPEEEFIAHSSNLELWYENDYNTRFLDKNLAFPLLKRLTEAGDPLARKVFKEEIAKRYKSGFPSVVKYLEEEGYLKYLSKEELESLK